MAKKKSAQPADNMMTSAAKAIGSTLGKLAAAAGLEHPAGAATKSAPKKTAKKTEARKVATRATLKKSVPAKKVPSKTTASSRHGKKKAKADK